MDQSDFSTKCKTKDECNLIKGEYRLRPLVLQDKWVQKKISSLIVRTADPREESMQRCQRHSPCSWECLLISPLPPNVAFVGSHYENTPIQIYRHFPLQKLKIFRYKNSDIFHMSAQSIDCGYSLEPPRRGGSNEYPLSMYLSRNKKIIVYPCKPQFYYMKVGFRGVNII